MTPDDIISDVDKYILGTYARIPLTIKNGEGCWVWDYEGRKFLDFTTGIAVTSLGHSHPKLLEVINSQSREIIHTSNLFYLESQAKLAKTLVENSFADKVFFCNTGTEAVEGAIKFAKKWGSKNNKYKIVSTVGSFHGRTYGSLSATGTEKYHDGFEPLLEGFEFVPYGETEELRKITADNELCAVIVEPVQGENGVIIPKNGYLKEVKEICDENDLLLILDEIQVGMGRTGKLFAYEHEGIEPDIVTLAKALGGGVPCGAVLLNNRVAESITPGSHGTTFGGNPLAVSCATATLEIINDNKLLSDIGYLGSYFLDRLGEIHTEYPGLVSDVRGKGYILGVEFTSPETAKKVITKCIENGLLTIHTAGTVMRILPPLIAGREEIDFALNILNQSLKEVLTDG
ncbi:MAG: aspartate aminotransferase family protein [Thermodesulfobacteriota bacterium]